MEMDWTLCHRTSATMRVGRPTSEPQTSLTAALCAVDPSYLILTMTSNHHPLPTGEDEVVEDEKEKSHVSALCSPHLPIKPSPLRSTSPYQYEEAPGTNDEPGSDTSSSRNAIKPTSADDALFDLPPLPSIHINPASPHSWRRSIRKVFSGRNLRLSLQSIGVIYGDIGTSPLYTLTAIFSPSSSDSALTLDATNTADVLGVMSLLFWALTLVVSLKYVLIVLLADDNGEGGSFALLGLLRRHHPHSSHSVQSHIPTPSSFTPSGTRASTPLPSEESPTTEACGGEEEDADHGSHHSHPSTPVSHKRWLLHDPLRALTLLSFFGACLLIGDGVITPAISVLSAVEGIAVADTALSGLVVPLTLLILVLLFCSERFGTASISGLFSPIMLLWFLALFTLGLYNLVTSPSALTLSILGTVSPHYAVLFLYRHGVQSIPHMAAVVLCVTGVEAMFADMGHFDRASIRTSWLMLVYPSLVIHYLGQGVCLLVNPGISTQVFYGSIPVQDGVVFWFMVALSTCATIIASQALISGAFSITRIAIRLRFAPTLPIVHTSPLAEGHVYIPPVNWLLMTCTCACVLAFQTSTNLANAYGVCVCCDMLLTSIFLCTVMRMVWRKSVGIIAGYVVIFMTVDAAFLLGNLAKIEAGGWLPLSFALLLSFLLFVWEWGQRRLVSEQGKLPSPSAQWKEIASFAAVTRQLGVGREQVGLGWSVFFFQPDEGGEGESEGDDKGAPRIPLSAWKLFDQLRVIPSRTLFVALSTDGRVAYTQQESRVKCSGRLPCPLTGVEVRRLDVRYGFMQDEAVLIADDIFFALINFQEGDDSSQPDTSAHFILSGDEMVCDLSSLYRQFPHGRSGYLKRLRQRALTLCDWLRTLPRYWLMTGFNLLSRGTCHGDTYRLPSRAILKVVTKIDLM